MDKYFSIFLHEMGFVMNEPACTKLDRFRWRTHLHKNLLALTVTALVSFVTTDIAHASTVLPMPSFQVSVVASPGSVQPLQVEHMSATVTASLKTTDNLLFTVSRN